MTNEKGGQFNTGLFDFYIQRTNIIMKTIYLKKNCIAYTLPIIIIAGWFVLYPEESEYLTDQDDVDLLNHAEAEAAVKEAVERGNMEESVDKKK